MLKRFSHLFAYLLLVMMPLQGIAAANMLVCNSMMQTHKVGMSTENQASKQTSVMQQANSMPCHEHMTSSPDSKHKNTCKSTCGALCSTLCAMTALPYSVNTLITSVSSKLASSAEQPYASITLPNTRRPPIFLS